MTSLYHLRSAKGQSYRITKLDDDYQIESAYTVSASECDCPAGSRPTCRHRQMLPFFLAKGHINNGWMLDWHTRQWRKPLCEDGEATPIGEDFPSTPPVDEMSNEEVLDVLNARLEVHYQNDDDRIAHTPVIVPASQIEEGPTLTTPSSPEAPTRAEVEPARVPSATPRVGASTLQIKRRKI